MLSCISSHAMRHHWHQRHHRLRPLPPRPLHCICPSPDAAIPIRHNHRPLPTPAPEGPLPHGQGLFERLTTHIRVHDRIEDNMRRHVLQQVLVYRGAEDVCMREINQMEREMCNYLEWQLNVELKILKEFEDKVCHNFAGNGPYPAIILPKPSPSPFAHSGASSSPSIPSFGHRTSTPKSTPASIPSLSTGTVSSSLSPSTPDTKYLFCLYIHP